MYDCSFGTQAGTGLAVERRRWFVGSAVEQAWRCGDEWLTRFCGAGGCAMQGVGGGGRFLYLPDNPIYVTVNLQKVL